MIEPVPENIPDELRQYPQWVNWQAVERDGKITKPPYQSDGQPAKSNDPATWNSFPVVLAAAHGFDGVGFVLTQDDPFVGLDFDHCRCRAFDNLDSEIAVGLIQPEIAAHIKKLDSYTEISPSGRGIRVLLKGKLSVNGKRKGPIEAYQSGRYVTITGHTLEGFPKTIEYRQKELDAFYGTVFGEHPEPTSAPTVNRTMTADWREGLEKAFNSKSGADIRRLWDGDYSDYPSQSEADLALCSHLACWLSGDVGSIDSAFRESGLFRDKWDKKHHSDGRTYGQATIQEALKHYQEKSQGEGPAETEIREDWPTLANDALPGWIGDFVRLACEHSEADPAAVLITLLTRFAAEIGSGPYINIGDAKHRCRTYVVIVGASSKSRKGTSSHPVARLFAEIPSGCRCSSGPLSSGEGLIYAVRDEVKEWDKKKQEYEISDPGVTDKRLFVLDEEMAAALHCTKREGNTLSAIIRGLYDDGNAEPLTKSSRIKATGAHVVIVTHITEGELIFLFSQVQMSNGFANRFLWILSRRQRLMPLPSPMPDSELYPIRETVTQRINEARSLSEIRFSHDASELWAEAYPVLTMDYAGVTGSIVNRLEAHTVRLSLMYALAAGHREIKIDDLRAALSLVDYARRSAFKIFGGAIGDRKKQRILEALQKAEGKQMTLSDIRDIVFSRHIQSEELHRIVQELKESSLVDIDKISTGGAPKTIVKLFSYCEKSEKRDNHAHLIALNTLNAHKQKEISILRDDLLEITL